MIDRRVAAAELVTHLGSTGHLVDLAKRHPNGGWTDGGGFVPYTILWPQPTTFTPTMSSSHRGDWTIMQTTSVANDPDLALRVANDIRTLLLAPPATLDGRSVVQVLIESDGGPDRDPNDERLFYCVILPAIETFA